MTNGTRRCTKGQIYRKSYTRAGKRIAGRCIRSTTHTGERSNAFKARVLGRMTRRMRGVRHASRRIRTCPQGYVTRKAYVRVHNGRRTLVSSACVRDVGAPGKGLKGGPGIGPLRQGELARFGYSGIAGLSVEDRRAALKKAVAAYGSLTTWRKLNALSIYTRRTSPRTSAAAKSDMDWVRATYGLKAF